MMGFGDYGLLGGLGMGAGMVIWIGIIALVSWAFVVLLERSGKQPQEAPLEILKRRYARGEITQPEYDQAKRNLA